MLSIWLNSNIVNVDFKPGVLINKGESEENRKWTDRALMQEYGRIDSIEVEEEEDGDWIQRIRARCFPSSSPILPPRYGTDQHHQWSPWRQTGTQYRNPRLPRQLELSSSSHLSGYSDNNDGRGRGRGAVRWVANQGDQEKGLWMFALPFFVLLTLSFPVALILLFLMSMSLLIQLLSLAKSAKMTIASTISDLSHFPHYFRLFQTNCPTSGYKTILVFSSLFDFSYPFWNIVLSYESNKSIFHFI